MMHSLLSFIEYGIMPFCLICATVAIKYLTKKSARIKWLEFLSIGIDIILMCAFGAFIYGISVFNHFTNNNESQTLLVVSTCVSFFLFILAVIISVFIRHWGEYSKKSFWVQNIIGIFCLVALLYMVSTGNNLFAENHTKPTSQNGQTIAEPDSTNTK